MDWKQEVTYPHARMPVLEIVPNQCPQTVAYNQKRKSNHKDRLSKVKSEPAARVQQRPLAAHTSALCATCLAADRALHSLRHAPQYLAVCNGFTLRKEDAVCFECRARLEHFLRFRSRALRAQRALAAREETRCLSTLSCAVIEPDSAVLVDGDAVLVKEELLEDCLVTAEPLAPPSFQLDIEFEQAIEDDSDGKADVGAADKDDSETDTASETEEMPRDVEQQQYQADFLLCKITDDEYRAHMRRERASPRYRRARYKCALCALVFYNERYLRIHKLLHSPSRGNMKCKMCQQRFKTKHALQMHCVSHNRRFQCRHCHRVEYTYKKIYSHFRSEHDDTPRPCQYCNQQFPNYDKLRRHIWLTHNTKHPCTMCSRSFTSKQILERHTLMAHTKVSDVECEICHKKYKGEFNLKKHKKYAHENEKRPDENAYCAECDLQFPNVHRYKTHLRQATRHVSDQPYKFECDYCGKRCKEKASLRTHIELTHLKLPRYQCDVCQQHFPTVAYLRRHKRLKHTATTPRAKPYVCHLCEKAFTVRKSLAEHMNTHLGIRPFECKLCEATFAYSAALYNHKQLVHLKTKVGRGRNT